MRRFTNTTASTIQTPTLGVDIAPGQTVDLDIPDGQPAPDGLREEQPEEHEPAQPKGKPRRVDITEAPTERGSVREDR